MRGSGLGGLFLSHLVEDVAQDQADDDGAGELEPGGHRDILDAHADNEDQGGEDLLLGPVLGHDAAQDGGQAEVEGVDHEGGQRFQDVDAGDGGQRHEEEVRKDGHADGDGADELAALGAGLHAAGGAGRQHGGQTHGGDVAGQVADVDAGETHLGIEAQGLEEVDQEVGGEDDGPAGADLAPGGLDAQTEPEIQGRQEGQQRRDEGGQPTGADHLDGVLVMEALFHLGGLHHSGVHIVLSHCFVLPSHIPRTAWAMKMAASMARPRANSLNLGFFLPMAMKISMMTKPETAATTLGRPPTHWPERNLAMQPIMTAMPTASNILVS